MTVSGIMLKCDTTGIPTPHITWTSGDTGDIVGTGKYYQVPYVKCATKALRFYCHARNPMGNISSPEIHVKGKGAFMGYITDGFRISNSIEFLSFIHRFITPDHSFAHAYMHWFFYFDPSDTSNHLSFYYFFNSFSLS